MSITHMVCPIILPRKPIPLPQPCILTIHNRTVLSLRDFVYIVVMTYEIFSCLKTAATEGAAFQM
jgi:hypothetical protein